VKRFLQSEIGAAVVWVLCSLMMAAVVTPWLYRAGMHFAAVAQGGDAPAWLGWLGGKCERARYGLFFDRALMVSALGFLPLLLRRLKALKVAPCVPGPGTPVCGIASRIVVACVISGGLLWVLGMALGAAGAFVPKPEPPGLSKVVSRMLIPAVSASLLEEWLFRGVLLGLWLRFSRPATACIGTSLLFAFLHFLQPPAGASIGDPGHPSAGFELLGKILLHFTDPRFFVTDFATLTVVGLILAWARLRTGTLWFSIGLHAGWILAFQAFGLFYERVPAHPLHPWGVGESLRSGVLPLLTLALTAATCHFALRRFAPAGLAAHHRDDEDLAETGAAQGAGAFMDGGAGGQHVIDEHGTGR
jgi:membrane protease YdiL (CAAX protease family)